MSKETIIEGMKQAAAHARGEDVGARVTKHDTAGRAYAKLSELKVGDVLTPGGGFSCLKEGQRCQVEHDGKELYVDCADGGHVLSGQADDGEHLIGLYKLS